jgi:hypothetical protein
MNQVYELGEAKIANMEFDTTIKNKLFTDEIQILYQNNLNVQLILKYG